MSKVLINEAVLNWAVERSGKSFDALEDRFPRIREWASGEAQPTLRQLRDLSKATWTPLGFLFLDAPPEMPLPVKHFRTIDDGTPTSPSVDLLETVQAMQTRQGWMREFLLEEGQDALAFVGAGLGGVDAIELGRLMRVTLGLREGWAADQSTWTEALRMLKDSMESVGILVVINGIVGNNTRRKLNVDEFRGFVLADEYAPLVFVNGADGKAAQIFTLAHELAHLFLGSSAAFDLRDMQPAADSTEQACNQGAAEFLVPSGQLLRAWTELNRSAEPFHAGARQFKVSEIVVARRALELDLISKDDFLMFYQDYAGRDRQPASKRPTGGDFWANQNFRIGKRFGVAVVRAAREGRLLYSEAYRLTGLFGRTFEKFATRLEGVGA